MASRKAFLVRNLEDVEAYFPDDGDVLTWVAASGLWMPEVGGSGGGAFTDLSDVPGSYSGQGGLAVAVKGAEDGLEFVAFSGGGGGEITAMNRSIFTAQAAAQDAHTADNTWEGIVAMSGVVNLEEAGDLMMFLQTVLKYDTASWEYYNLRFKVDHAIMGTMYTPTFSHRKNSGATTHEYHIEELKYVLSGVPAGDYHVESQWMTTSNMDISFFDRQITLEGQWEFTGGGGDASSFLGLDDTPGNYTSAGGLAAVVNPGEDALEFLALDHGGLGGLADDDHVQYLLADGSRIADTLTIGDGTGARYLDIDGAAGSARQLRYRTAGVNRWIVRANNTAEGGSDAGSDFEISARDDAGAQLSIPLKIIRSTGDIYTSAGLLVQAGLRVGSLASVADQGCIRVTNDVRMGGGLSVGSETANPASGYGVIANGLSIGDTTPPYSHQGAIYLDFGTPQYGFLSAPEPLFMSAGTWYDGGNWRQLGTGTSATFYISNTSGLVFRVDNTSRSPGDVNFHTNVLLVDNYGNMKLGGGIVVGNQGGTVDDDMITFYQGGVRVGEIGSTDANWLRINDTTNLPIYTPRYMRVDGGLSATSSLSNPGAGNVVAQKFRLYDGTTDMGGLTANETVWLRINQDIAKDIYTPRTFCTAAGLISGTSALPGAGGTGYTVSLRPYKNTTFYSTYSYHAYATKKTSTSFDGDAKSTTASTKIDLSAVFGVPAGVKAVQCRIYARDNAGHIQTGLYLGVGYSSADPFNLTVRPVGNDAIMENNGMVTCDSNGDIWWRCGASGGGTLDIWIEILGYMI